jgi:C-type mannose receptor
LSKGCAPGWYSYGSHCYYFNHVKAGAADWNDAANTCNFLGARLADIRSEAEWNFVKGPLQTGTQWSDQYWIGINDSQNEGSWKYIDGTAVSFLRWYPGEPNSGTSGNCGALYGYQSSGKYNDSGCSAQLGRFVCKQW